ncbi:hypothetical protein CRG98_012682, partial [Punica granatum]
LALLKGEIGQRQDMPAGLLKKDDLKATAEGLRVEGGSEAKLKPVIGGAFMAISLDNHTPKFTGRKRREEERGFFVEGLRAFAGA